MKCNLKPVSFVCSSLLLLLFSACANNTARIELSKSPLKDSSGNSEMTDRLGAPDSGKYQLADSQKPARYLTFSCFEEYLYAYSVKESWVKMRRLEKLSMTDSSHGFGITFNQILKAIPIA